LLLSISIAVIAIELKDLEEELEDTRVSFRDNDDDNEDFLTLGELRELEQLVQRDAIPKPRTWVRWRRVRRFFRKAGHFVRRFRVKVRVGKRDNGVKK